MSSVLSSLAAYGSTDESEDDSSRPPLPLKVPKFSVECREIAPAVTPRGDPNAHLRFVPTDSKVVTYNPTYEELCAPRSGPLNPNIKGGVKLQKNVWHGQVESGDVNDFHFEDQRQTFSHNGYALDPSVDDTTDITTNTYIGDNNNAKTQGFESNATVAAAVSNKRKRQAVAQIMRNRIMDNVGPSEQQMEDMGKYVDSAPDQVTNKKERKKVEPESTTLHVKEVDYQGRTYMHAPHDLGKLGATPAKCFLPKAHIHTWTGHTKGVTAVRYLPKTAHLMLSCSNDNSVKLWEFYGDRRKLRTFTGHTQGVRDIQFNNSGERFLSCGYDRMVRLWDTETGQCIRKFTNKKTPYCIKFHPDEDKQHLFVCGTSDNHILTYDTNSGEQVQDYDRHLGAVNAIEFVEEGRRMVSTSDDKSIRIWEWDIPVDTKYIADPSMHSMPYMAIHPNKKSMILQSMDNKIVTFGASNTFRQNMKKTFKGHKNAGYACQLGFSPDGSYVISGDGDGFLAIWDWKSCKRYAKIRAHDQVCIGASWHPYETSKVVTCSWDGTIKLWD